MSKDTKLGVALVKRACKVCHNLEDSEILMNKQLNASQAKKVEEMHGQVVGWIESNPYGFCKACLEESKKNRASFLVTIDPDKTDDMSNPWRTGGIFLLKNTALKKIFGEERYKLMIKHRAAYIDDETARIMQLPMDYLDGNN